MRIYFISISFLFFLAGSLNAFAMSASTVVGYPACVSESALDEMLAFSTSDNIASMTAYIELGRCVIMKGGLPVTVTQSPGISDGKTEFVFQGKKLWILSEGITF